MVPKRLNSKGRKKKAYFYMHYTRENVMSAQMLEMSLLGVGMVLRLDSDA